MSYPPPERYSTPACGWMPFNSSSSSTVTNQYPCSVRVSTISSAASTELEIIDHLTEQCYRFKTVSQLAAVRDQTMEAGGLYTKFP